MMLRLGPRTGSAFLLTCLAATATAASLLLAPARGTITECRVSGVLALQLGVLVVLAWPWRLLESWKRHLLGGLRALGALAAFLLLAAWLPTAFTAHWGNAVAPLLLFAFATWVALLVDRSPTAFEEGELRPRKTWILTMVLILLLAVAWWRTESERVRGLRLMAMRDSQVKCMQIVDALKRDDPMTEPIIDGWGRAIRLERQRAAFRIVCLSASGELDVLPCAGDASTFEDDLVVTEAGWLCWGIVPNSTASEPVVWRDWRTSSWSALARCALTCWEREPLES